MALLSSGSLPTETEQPSSVRRVLTRLAVGAAAIGIGTAGGQLARLLSNVTIARILEREQFGELGIVQNTVGMLSTFAVFGLGVSSAKFVGEFRLSDPARAGNVIAFVEVASSLSIAFISLIGYLIAPIIASEMMHRPTLAGDLRLAVILVGASALGSIQIGTLTGLNAFKSVARITLAGGVLSLVFGVLGAALGEVRGALWGFNFAAALTCALGTRWTHREAGHQEILIDFRRWTVESAVLLRFSLPALLAGLFAAPCLWLTQTILVRQPAGLSEMAVFSAAFHWRVAVLFAPSVLARALLPIIAELAGRQQAKVHRSANLAVLGVTAMLVLLLSGAICLFSPQIMAAYGNSYTNGAGVLALVTLGAALSAINGMMSTTLASIGRMWVVFVANASWALAAILLSMFLVPRYLAFGLSMSMLGAEMISTIIVAISWSKCLQMKRV